MDRQARALALKKLDDELKLINEETSRKEEQHRRKMEEMDRRFEEMERRRVEILKQEDRKRLLEIAVNLLGQWAGPCPSSLREMPAYFVLIENLLDNLYIERDICADVLIK